MKSIHTKIAKKTDQIFNQTSVIAEDYNIIKIKFFTRGRGPEIIRIKRKIFRHVANSTLTDPKDLV